MVKGREEQITFAGAERLAKATLRKQRYTCLQRYCL